jgi:CRISPR/Cas system CSM-associated protein Csm2 small subunit
MTSRVHHQQIMEIYNVCTNYRRPRKKEGNKEKIVLDLGFFYFMDFLSPASFVPNN